MVERALVWLLKQITLTLVYATVIMIVILAIFNDSVLRWLIGGLGVMSLTVLTLVALSNDLITEGHWLIWLMALTILVNILIVWGC